MQVTLQVLTGSRTGERIFLTVFPATLGRNQSCDVVFGAKNDAGVSNHHAVITLEGNAPVIRDMNSTNGTYVEGQRIKRFILVDSLVVRLAMEGPEFRVLLDEEAIEAAKKGVERESGKLPAQGEE
ncbi:MAG: FHA domain-containing protein [Planctomycetota bacterium]|jgi:pSer/pThr/pTyr-binding forkhead associated (FHA) protein